MQPLVTSAGNSLGVFVLDGEDNTQSRSSSVKNADDR